MAKNLLPLIIKELGLEEGDVFTIENDDKRQYRFNNGFLEMSPGCTDNDWSCAPDDIFVELVLGEFDIDEVFKPPFEPKWKNKYFSYANYSWEVIEDIWEGTLTDYMRKVSGCVFRSYEEACFARPAKYKEVTGKKW